MGCPFPIARDHCDEATPDERAPFRFVVVSFSSKTAALIGRVAGGGVIPASNVFATLIPAQHHQVVSVCASHRTC
jgi:hypothetical protein